MIVSDQFTIGGRDHRQPGSGARAGQDEHTERHAGAYALLARYGTVAAPGVAQRGRCGSTIRVSGRRGATHLRRSRRPHRRRGRQWGVRATEPDQRGRHVRARHPPPVRPPGRNAVFVLLPSAGADGSSTCGQADVARAAMCSPGAHGFIVLASTAKDDTISEIVTRPAPAMWSRRRRTRSTRSSPSGAWPSRMADRCAGGRRPHRHRPLDPP